MKLRNLILAGCLFLVACASEPVVVPSKICPQVAIIRGLQKVSDFGLEAELPSNLVSSAQLVGVEGQCNLHEGDADKEDDLRGVDVNFTLKLKADKGPRLGGDAASFSYFASMLAPDQTIISKKLLTADVRFKDAGSIEQEEDLHIFIPLPDKNALAKDYRVLLGFQLTEAQLKAVRSQKKN